MDPDGQTAGGGRASARVQFVAGKGGTGKSTLAAALAMHAAGRGLSVLAVQLNSHSQSLARCLDCSPLDGEIRQVRERIWAVNIVPGLAMREYLLMQLRFLSVYTLVFENRMVKYLLRAVPALNELVMLGKIMYHAGERDAEGRPRFDRIVVDTPATGHGLAILHLPWIVASAVGRGPVARHSAEMMAMLTDPAAAAVHVVALPEELPVNESLHVCRSLAERSIARDLLLVNRCGPWPPEPAGGACLPDADRDDPEIGPLVRSAERALAAAAREREELARLAAAQPDGVVTAPDFFAANGPAAVCRAMRELLDGSL